jgi:hypothetical protein
LKPRACSARPGIGGTRDTDPGASTRRSQVITLVSPSGGCTVQVRRSTSRLTALPITRRVRRSTRRSGTTTCLGSTVPDAASGSSGV